MAEIPDTVDVAQDFITEAVELDEDVERHPRWHKHVAVTTLVMALLTALGAMLASMSANQSLIERTQEIIEVNALEGDRVNIEILKSKHEILAAVGKVPDQVEVNTIAKFDGEMQTLELQSASEEEDVLGVVAIHHIFAVGVTFLSLGTALCGMSVIVNRKALWYWSLLFGALGAAGLMLGLIRMYL